MVRAILEGRKTQTRRVMKSQPSDGWHPEVGIYAPLMVDRRGEEYPGPDVFGASDEDEGRVFPYGQPGDRLWVRESHALDGGHVFYRLGHEEAKASGPRVDIKWRSPIFMPRWASRITLEIADVRVQRLHEIGHPDICAEGIGRYNPESTESVYQYGRNRREFELLWESINGPGSWDANPWVWAITFRRINGSSE